jgi:hypothetical protein
MWCITGLLITALDNQMAFHTVSYKSLYIVVNCFKWYGCKMLDIDWPSAKWTHIIISGAMLWHTNSNMSRDCILLTQDN